MGAQPFARVCGRATGGRPFDPNTDMGRIIFLTPRRMREQRRLRPFWRTVSDLHGKYVQVASDVRSVAPRRTFGR